ncbi:flagellar assembly peptidoglycan hydrolase FlgJ [Scandinavium sp.]|uniref:flagellar assembly peptidoglycan hydrolase FlgJ n=1 Tax=Scandinavium sp. TaxID=2830653 RepID=UPI0028A266A0|nr:flagellar assembly peptidoglycan hydrolase FlgJ [Scandinavium sp.]
MDAKSLVSGAAFDVRGLDSLKREARTNSAEGLKAAAKQMEGMFVQMMLKSMRDATMKDDLMHSQSSDMFTSMYDQQISQDIASRGSLGFADMMVKQLGGEVDAKPVTKGVAPAPYSLLPGQQKIINSAPMQRAPGAVEQITSAVTGSGDNQSFISRLLGPAISVAKKSGIPHQLIIAQAALESGWGNREIPTANGKSSHNLFGIKATPDWQGESTEITTTEYINGVAKKVKAAFRVYPSYSEALADYASLLTQNPRYKNVARSSSPETAAHALQKGGYATDPSYARKLIQIMGQVKGSVNQGLNAYKTDLSSLF